MKDDTQGATPVLKIKKIRKFSIIFNEGDAGDAAYIIRSGQVEIRKGVHLDHPQKLAELGKGSVLGEMALFDDRPRMAQAIAMTDVVLIEMSREDFLEKLSTIDPVMKGMMLAMVSRVRQMADEFMVRKTDTNWSNWKRDR